MVCGDGVVVGYGNCVECVLCFVVGDEVDCD